MKNWIGSLFVFVLALSASAAPGPADETLDTFYQQIKLIDDLTDTAQRDDLPSVLAVRNMITAIISEVQANRQSHKKKDVTFHTQTLIQALMIQYRFSSVLFGWTEPRSLLSIYTDDTADTLARLKAQTESVNEEYAFNEAPYTTITANTFRQMHTLFLQIETLEMDPNLKAQLVALKAPIGDAIAVAEQGDRPKAYAAAMPIVTKIRDLYPAFDAVATAQAGFMTVLELKGLNEFYAEFAQMENH
jgi:hypothetical protein